MIGLDRYGTRPYLLPEYPHEKIDFNTDFCV